MNQLIPLIPLILSSLMTIYLARHAWAGHFGDAGWPDDSQRPLTPEGVERYRQMLARLAEGGFAPERVATSPYVRCAQTAELIAEATGASVDPVDELAIGADLTRMLAWTEASSAQRVCWCGHNPDMPRLAAQLLGDGHADIRFAKGAVAAIRFEGGVAERAAGTLLWHATAKLLGV